MFRVLPACMFLYGACLMPFPDDSLDSGILLLPGNSYTDAACKFFAGTFQGPDCDLGLTGRVTTFAGDGTAALVDDTGTNASFNNPRALTTDGATLYVADSSNFAIRRIDIATGRVTTLAGSGGTGYVDATGTAASFGDPVDLTSDGGNIYVCDKTNHVIRKIEIASGQVTTFAGNGTPAYLDGTGTAAALNEPRGITNDGTYLYLTETGNDRVRRIRISDAEVITLAGDGTQASVDGTGTAASFANPVSATTNGADLFVLDRLTQSVRTISLSSTEVTTIAGTGVAGSADGTGTAASFNLPQNIDTDGVNLYVADTNNHTVRKIVTSSREVSTLAGQAGTAGYADGTGGAALFNKTRGFVSDGTYLYAADATNHRIRRIE